MMNDVKLIMGQIHVQIFNVTFSYFNEERKNFTEQIFIFQFFSSVYNYISNCKIIDSLPFLYSHFFIIIFKLILWNYINIHVSRIFNVCNCYFKNLLLINKVNLTLYINIFFKMSVIFFFSPSFSKHHFYCYNQCYQNIHKIILFNQFTLTD